MKKLQKIKLDELAGIDLNERGLCRILGGERPETANVDACMLVLVEGRKQGIIMTQMSLEVITQQPVLLHRINVLVLLPKHSVYHLVNHQNQYKMLFPDAEGMEVAFIN